ncbi:MAG TPA: hypothetical protein VF990_01390 [Candidatus Dormibacteraeota bacterium]
MWPFQRKAEAPADSGSRPTPAPVIRRDWTGLAPIQRLIGQHPLTAPSDRFSDDLATHHDPSVSTEPMGHQVSAEAPAGIVLALARPTTRNDGPAMISRPRVQRRVQGAIAESGEWDGDEAASPATRPAPLPAGPQAATVRELPVVTPAPVAQRLTTLSPEVEPVPVESPPRRSRIEQPLDLSATSRADLSDAPVAAPPRLTLGQARRLGLGAPISRVPGRAVQRAIAQSTAMPLAPSSVPQPSIATKDAAPARPDRTAGSPEEATTTAPLDLPLAPRESTRIPQPDASLEAGGLSVEPPVQRAMDISAASSTDRATDNFTDAATPGPTEIPLKPVATLPLVQRSQIQRAPTLSSPASDHRETRASHTDLGREPQSFPLIRRGELEASPGSVQGEVSAPTLPSPVTGRGELHGELAPLVSARPLRPTTLQRSTEPAPIDPYPAAPLADETSTYTDEIVLPSPRAASPDGPTRSLVLPELTAVAAQPRYGPVPQNHQLAASRHVQLQASSGRSFVRAAALPLAPLQRTAAAESPQQEPGGEWTSEVVQREIFSSPSAGVSTLSSPGPSPADAGSAASTVASAAGSMFGRHNPIETDMDELAGKLYDRIRTRLKSELLVDRERAGLLTDLR